LTEPATQSAAEPAAGLFRFSLEGRRAPALFVSGWLATIIGAATTGVGFASSPGGAALLLAAVGLALLSLGLVLLGGSQTVERTAAELAYGGPSPVLVFLAVVAVSLFVAIVIGAVLSSASVTLPLPVGDLISTAIQALVFVGVVQLMVIGTGALRWSDMGFAIGPRQAAEALARGALLAAPVVILTAIVAAIVVGIAGVTPPSPLPSTGTVSGLLLHLLAGAIVAPIAEEVLFRGFMVTAWARSNGAGAAIIRAALLFATAHVLLVGGDNFGQAASLAFVGAVGRLPVALALGWLYLRSRTIWAPIGLHAAFNAILLIAAELATGSLGS
jgi:uncharacterized protein